MDPEEHYRAYSYKFIVESPPLSQIVENHCHGCIFFSFFFLCNFLIWFEKLSVGK